MRIGVISDTHDRLDNIERALSFFAEQNIELVIHCGDWKSLSTLHYFADKAAAYHLPVRGVLGNNDLDVAAFLTIARVAPGSFELKEGVFELDLDGVSAVIYHGHHAPTLRCVRENQAYSLVFLGHTHKPNIEEQDGRLLINPGSTAFSIPRSKEWIPSVAIVDTATMSSQIHYL